MDGQASISIGNFRVGWLRVDPAMVRGEGGCLSPALVVPSAIQLDPRQEGEAIAITEIEAELVLPTNAEAALGPGIGMPARVSGMRTQAGMWSSIPSSPVEHQVTFRFSLAREQVRLLEAHAQRMGEEQVRVGLRIHAATAWVRQTQNAPRPGPSGHPVAAALGLTSELWSLGAARIEPLELRLRREDWATQVLPDLGADEVRLIAVRLPRTSRALGPEAAVAIDAVRQRYDEGDYRGAIQSCRDLRDTIADHLDADGKPIAECIGERLGWPVDSPAKVLLDNLWKTLSDLSSAAHHREGKQFGGAEARAAVLIAATAVEYLTEILGPSARQRTASHLPLVGVGALQRNQLPSLGENLDCNQGRVVPILLASRCKPHLSNDLLQSDNSDRPGPNTLACRPLTDATLMLTCSSARESSRIQPQLDLFGLVSVALPRSLHNPIANHMVVQEPVETRTALVTRLPHHRLSGHASRSKE